MINLSRRQLAKYAADRIEGSGDVDSLGKELAAALIAIGKVNDIELLLSDIDYELEERNLVAQARITAARPLTAELRQEIINAVKQASSVEQVETEVVIDKSIIGGIRVETAYHSWDRSIKRKLKDIKEAV